MTGLRGGCTGCRGADDALPKASKIQKERHLLSADVSLLRRDGQNRYFKISKRYRRPTPPAFWPAAHLRRTGALPQAKPRRRRNSLPPSISNSPGYHKNNHTRQVWLFLWKGRLKSIFWMDETIAEEPPNGPSGPRRECAVPSVFALRRKPWRRGDSLAPSK